MILPDWLIFVTEQSQKWILTLRKVWQTTDDATATDTKDAKEAKAL